MKAKPTLSVFFIFVVVAAAVMTPRQEAQARSRTNTTHARRRHASPTPTPTRTPTATPTPTPTATPTPPSAARVEKGIGLVGLPSPIPSYVDNLFIPVSAAAINPSPGVYDFSSIQNAVNAATDAGKGFSLALYFGVDGTPAWFYSEGGVQSLAVSEGTVPVPWDSNYLNYAGQIIAALGSEYNSNPNLVSVKLGGLNLNSGEMHIIGASTVDNTAWLGIGYSASLIESSFLSLQANYNAAFPGVEQIGGIMPNGGWPLTGTTNDSTLNNTLLGFGGWYEQFDGLTGAALNTPAQGMTCYQAGAPLGTALQTAVDEVLAQPSANCLEIYPQDATDANASMLATAGTTLKSR